jgi:hypothetical protein
VKNLITIIQSKSTGKNVILFFIPAMIVYALMLSYTIPKVEEHSDGKKLFDLLPGGYSYEYAKELLTVLGDKGRDLYLYIQLPLDFLYPGLFAISCSLLLSWLFLKITEPSSRWFYFCLIPVAAGAFDYAENILIVSMISGYPDISQGQVEIASLVMISKSALTTLFFIVLTIVGISCFAKYGKSKKNSG